MTTKDDGGPAFPLVHGDGSVDPRGMSLRDYFAAAALSGICGDGIPGSHHAPAPTAEDAYRYADAMIAERGR